MSGLAPWHLWGNSQSLTFTQVASVNNPPTTQQLVKIAYRRPETWTFLFYLQITNATPCVFIMPSFTFKRSISILKTSPGRTGLRNLALSMLKK